MLIAGWSGKSVAERYGECPVSDMRGDRSSEGGRTGKKVGGERSHGSKVRDHLAVGRSLIPFPREEKNEKKERKKKNKDNSRENSTHYERATSRRRSRKRMKEEMKQKRKKKRSEDREMITEGQAAKRKTEKGNIRRQLHS